MVHLMALVFAYREGRGHFLGERRQTVARLIMLHKSTPLSECCIFGGGCGGDKPHQDIIGGTTRGRFHGQWLPMLQIN